jgi:gamma-glutamylputrescine oxidase
VEVLDRDALGAYLASAAYFGGSIDHGAGHIHPLRFALGLARAALEAGAALHEQSEVHRIDIARGTGRHRVATASGQVEAAHVIVGANGYLGRLIPQVAARVMPINNFIAATEPLPEGAAVRQGVAVADSDFVVNYYRMSADNRLLFGGGESYGYRFPRDLDRVVRKPLARVFPDLADTPFAHVWGGTLAITLSRMPYLARLHPTVLSASGYSGHGVALATLAGKLMAGAVRGEAQGFDLMASLPARRFPGGTVARSPLLALAMGWYALRDRIGV